MNAESLYDALCASFEKLNIPWENVVSVLLDSCAVMRGPKSGLETRIRNEKQNGLLDIDGDVCHHIHNASKAFCAPFGGDVEQLFDDLFNDLRWSSDIQECLSKICDGMKLASTKPERFIRHRWLSCYDSSVSTIRLFDAYFLLYYGFLSSSEQQTFKDKMEEKRSKYGIDESMMEKICSESKKKRKTLTNKGRSRKERIIDKIFYREVEMKLVLNFYVAIFPLLKEYVLLFQSQRPLIHRLHERQEKLLRNFLSCFMQPNFVKRPLNQLITLSLNEENMLSQHNIHVGNASKILQRLSINDILVKRFYQRVKDAFVQCATYLQKKLPLDNPLLRAAASLDPALQHDLRLPLMKQLKSHAGHFLSEEEYDHFDLECHKFAVDMSLPPFEEEKTPPDRLDSWWATVNKLNQYPAVCKMALTLCTIFHGPLVSFALLFPLLCYN